MVRVAAPLLSRILPTTALVSLPKESDIGRRIQLNSNPPLLSDTDIDVRFNISSWFTGTDGLARLSLLHS